MWHRFFPVCSLLLVLLGAATALGQNPAPKPASPLVVSLAIEAALSPIQADLFDAAVQAAQTKQANLVLLRLDTPGGSVDVMRRMVKTIGQSTIPIAIWVGPSGARADSAGVFLIACAPIAAMAPQTTLGSASPVGLGGGDLNKTLDAKIRNDLTSLIRSLATTNGRNAAWYQRAVTEAANLTAAEAVQQQVVDFLAVSPADLLDQIGKRGLSTPDGLLRFTGASARLEPYEPSLRHTLLAWLLDPQIAYILLLIGVAGIFFELTTPGAILPGVVGGLCLLPALYALSILPTNAAGLLLLLFGGGLFLLEIHITSYGLLSLAGLAALFIGSMLLFDANGPDRLPLRLILPTVIGVSAILAAAGWILAKAQRQKPKTGLESLIGQTATVRHWKNGRGKVFIRGELWDAVAQSETNASASLRPEDVVVVIDAKDMLLIVAPASDA